MHLPHTILPVLCCLFILVVHDVAGLAVLRGAPGNAILAKADVGASFTGARAHRRQTVQATFQAAAASHEASLPKIDPRQTATTLLATFQPAFQAGAESAAESVKTLQAAAKATAQIGTTIATFEDANDAAVHTLATFRTIANAATTFQDVFKGTAGSKAATEAVALFQEAAKRADETITRLQGALLGIVDNAAKVADFQEVVKTAAAAAGTFDVAVVTAPR